MGLFGKTTVRQKEIRRSLAERRLTWRQRAAEQVRVWPQGVLLAGALAAAILVTMGDDPLGLRPGQWLARAITSRVTFSLEDPVRTQENRTIARNNADDYYILDESLLQDIRGRLTNALLVAREQAADRDRLRANAAAIKVVLDDAGLEEMVRLAGLTDSAEYEQALDQAVNILRREPLVEAEDTAQRGEGEAPRRLLGLNAVLLDPEATVPRRVSLHQLYFESVADDVTKVAQTAAAAFARPLRESVKNSLIEMLRASAEGRFKPLYRYDPDRSDQAAEEAASKVPMERIVYPVDAVLAGAGELTAAELQLLREEQRQYLVQVRSAPAVMTEPEVVRLQALRDARHLGLAARALLAFLVSFGLGGYIALRDTRTIGSPRQFLATTLTLLLALGAARGAYLITGNPFIALGAQAFAVALLAITSGRAPAQAAAGVLALMITLATRQGTGYLVVMAALSAILFLGLRDVRNRGRIVAVGAMAALAALVTTLLISKAEGQHLAFAFWGQAAWAGLMTLAAVFVVEGILPAIERLFGVTTSMTLLEWCDPNKPLLRLLATESPGTYNHSLMVGTLADAAATAIGANGLLARAGAYYHDIGKINKAEYFVENQSQGMVNRHDRLSPAMSHLIIIGHVKDGTAMAREYGLPAALHAFIPEHHGTCVIEYFYHAANRARKPGEPPLPDTDFRYPGPKPQSRETAIVMMCDTVEGAVRAMPEPTPGRISDVVAALIQKRLVDGQFDECDLTFHELADIRAALIKSLNSIYHGRIAYPQAERRSENGNGDQRGENGSAEQRGGNGSAARHDENGSGERDATPSNAADRSGPASTGGASSASSAGGRPAHTPSARPPSAAASPEADDAV